MAVDTLVTLPALPAGLPGTENGVESPSDLRDLATLIAEGQRIRDLCQTINQSMAATRRQIDETQRQHAKLTKLCRVQQRKLTQLARGRKNPRGPKSVGNPRSVEAYLAAIDQARLDGAMLAARTAAHLINNDLTSTIILDQMIRRQIDSGEAVDPRLLDSAIDGAKRAAHHLKELQQVARIEFELGFGTSPSVLDLALSRRIGGS